MKIKRIVISLLIFSLVPALSFSQNFSDHLILQDIGPYKLEAPQKVVGGYIGGPRVFDGAGVIAPTGHFYLDHTDKTYEAYYEGGSALLSATVQVTQHAGSDSDKWLLHEVDRDFRNYYGSPGRSYGPHQIDGQTIMEDLVGGGHYRWISGNNIVAIEYRDAQMTKPEPIEIVKAYLAKHPSTLSAFTIKQLRSTESTTKWIKDEMDRRLWLCDKWFGQMGVGKADQKNVMQQQVKSMNVFLDCREKYFGISAKDEKNLLAQHLMQSDITNIQTKLTGYKVWWTAHKGDSISL